ncbi:GNAT family N-acetyltransferase [Sulfobacillus thermosulfidooxidans]|uniref:GNAT family N-acetyltransferase n=1 Tax=Sulfobacillus thermosulfidooxidans TaxID=28034 RepID=UPI0006B666DE|nr:GNAT family N-acetyltransferase [Sulfobacillus thermosulfidooxidans]
MKFLISDSLLIAAVVTHEDHEFIREIWRTHWGGAVMVSRGKIYHISELSALIAKKDDKYKGALTYSVCGEESECITLNALTQYQGIGTALVLAWENWARQHHVKRLWLITSNDNLKALRFYQKRGFRLCRIYPGAIDAARCQKPSIPLWGDKGIPIHDEIELEKWLTV